MTRHFLTGRAPCAVTFRSFVAGLDATRAGACHCHD